MDTEKGDVTEIDEVDKISDAAVERAINWYIEQFDPVYQYDDLAIWDEQDQTVNVGVPETEDGFVMQRDEFLQAMEEVANLKFVVTEGTVWTPKRALQIVAPYSEKTFQAPERLSLPLTQDGLRCSALKRNFFVTFAAFKCEAWEEDFQPADGYQCIEVIFDKAEKEREASFDKQLIETVLFELASEGFVFRKAPFTFFQYPDDESKLEVPSFRPLEPFNEGIRLLNAAVTIDDPDLRFLSLYKVLEFFAPIVIRLERNEALRKKLDSPIATHPDANFLESLFELSLAMRDWAKDAELPRQVLLECVDFIELMKLLPKQLQRPLTYDPRKRGEVEAHIKTVADALYATRNRVAHAKSNYQPQGAEIQGDAMDPLNEFMEASARQAIRWYNRLPKHLRLSFQ